VHFAAFALLVTAVMVTLLVAAQALVAQGSFRLSALSREASRLRNENGELAVRVAQLSVAERIAAAARRSGLVLPERMERLVLGEDRG
jgi:cell division protein FtsL